MSEICNSSTSKRRNMDFKWALGIVGTQYVFRVLLGSPTICWETKYVCLKCSNFAELRSVTLVREYGLAARKDGEQIYFGWFLSAPWIHATFTQVDFSTQNGGGAASSATLQSPLDVTSVVCYPSCLIIHDVHHILGCSPTLKSEA